jgi:hypothetical protein
MEPQANPLDGEQLRPDDFPGLYRAVLDAAAELERRGDRSAAARLRREAADAYSVWDEQGRRRLIALLTGTRRPGRA